MHVEIEISPATPGGQVIVTWTPREAHARLVDPPAGVAQMAVTIASTGAVGQLSFGATREASDQNSLPLSLPADGTPVTFWFAGRFGHPSENFGDAVLAVLAGDGTELASVPCMVRIRKSTEKLSDAERDRFLDALAALNDNGLGRFTDFRDMHTAVALPEAHGDNGFLPWHRAYLLDLERELQAIDSTVALPYWRFDEAAPKLFRTDFIGLPNASGVVQFSAGHPLLTWVTNGVPGISRRMSFLPGNAPAGLRSEAATIALGGVPPNGQYSAFAVMEGNPHGRAHTSFSGFVSAPHTAPRDPLFFLLHCNVDRLWALWQFVNDAMSSAAPGAFADGNRIGHRAGDTMWPWNAQVNPPRPGTAPGGNLAPSPHTSAPTSPPRVSEMIDYQGAAGGLSMHFAYDTVPFKDVTPQVGV